MMLGACLSYAYILVYQLSQVFPDSGSYVMFHFSCLTSEVMHACTAWMYSTTVTDFYCKHEIFPITCHEGTEGK
jgi:hypothetical protein